MRDGLKRGGGGAQKTTAPVRERSRGLEALADMRFWNDP